MTKKRRQPTREEILAVQRHVLGESRRISLNDGLRDFMEAAERAYRDHLIFSSSGGFTAAPDSALTLLAQFVVLPAPLAGELQERLQEAVDDYLMGKGISLQTKTVIPETKIN